MKSLLILLWFGIMTMGIQAQNEERSKKKEGRVPAQSQTNKTHKIKEVKVQPQFSIGYFILNEIEYPKESLDLLDEGQVVVQFKVQPNGEIRDIEVLNSVSEKLDEQVISCLKRTNGKWTPDEENGKPVESIRKMLVTSVCLKTYQAAIFEFKIRFNFGYLMVGKHFSGTFLLMRTQGHEGQKRHVLARF